MTEKTDQILKERYELSLGRIREIEREQAAAPAFVDYFQRTAGFLL